MSRSTDATLTHRLHQRPDNPLLLCPEGLCKRIRAIRPHTLTQNGARTRRYRVQLTPWLEAGAESVEAVQPTLVFCRPLLSPTTRGCPRHQIRRHPRGTSTRSRSTAARRAGDNANLANFWHLDLVTLAIWTAIGYDSITCGSQFSQNGG